MHTYEDDVNEFYRIIDLMNARVNQFNQETKVNWSSPDYSWDGQLYKNQVEQLQTKFKSGNLDYESLENQIKQIIENADDHKTEISNNIYQLINAPEMFDKANQLEKDFDDFNNLAYDIIDECYAYEKNKAANPFENMQANAKVNTSGTNSTTTKQNIDNSGTVVIPPGKRLTNQFFHGYWKDKNSRFPQSFIQNGSSVKMANIGTGQIIEGVLKYKGKEWDGFQVDYEFSLKGNGYTMEQQCRNSRGVVTRVVELTFCDYKPGPSTAASDSDKDGVINSHDLCPNTPKGLTVNNGGVDIMGCPTGQNPNKQTNTASTEINNQEESEDPFASSILSSSSQQTQSFDQQNNSFNSNVTKPQNEKPYSEPIGKVGTVSNDGNGDGTYCSLAVEKINDSDVLGFSVLSGTMVFVQVIYRDKTGFWRTKYEGKRTEFKASEFLKDIPGNITHLNFIVNSNHNYFKRGDEPCEMEVWHLPANGKIPIHSVATQASQINNNKLSGEFEALLEKANAAFVKPYWEDSNSGNVTINATNPKQESLDYLRKAEQIINRQSNLSTKFNMVCRLANVSSGFAKRVYVYTAKNDFIQLAGKLLSKFSNTISSITKDVNGMSAPKVRSMSYKKV
jgi:hypothetical protein